MNEKERLENAIEKLGIAFDLLREADEVLDSLGIDVNGFSYQPWVRSSKASVLLSKGIMILSKLSEAVVESDEPYPYYGRIMLNGIDIHQHKAIVTSEGWYK